MPNDLRKELEERTFCFAEAVALSVTQLSKTHTNIEYMRQLVRSSGSVGAAYLEANSALRKRDYVLRLSRARKEMEASAYWIRLIIHTNDNETAKVFEPLMREATELKRILSAMIRACM